MNIIDIAIKSLVAAAFGLIVFALMRRRSAAARHTMLALTLFSLCALPILTPVLPHWSVPFIRVPAPNLSAPIASVPAPVEAVSQVLPAVSDFASPTRMYPDTAILILWASIAGLLGLRVFARLSRLRKLEHSLPMCSQPELQALVAEYCRRHRRHFLLLEGESNEPPMTWGHGRPVLLLPSSARDWPTDRLRSVMLHELAHVERRDWVVSLAGEIVCALFWFNPLVWIMRKRLEIESEQAADEWVVSMGVPRTDYATHLVELLRDLNRFPRSADAAVGMTRPGRLDARVKAILLDGRPARPLRGSASIGLAAIVLLAVAAIGAAGPTVVRAANKPDLAPAKDLLAQEEFSAPELEPPAVHSPIRNGTSSSKAFHAGTVATSETKRESAPANVEVSTRPVSQPVPEVSGTWAGPSAKAVGADQKRRHEPFAGYEPTQAAASGDDSQVFDEKAFDAKISQATDEFDRSVAEIQQQSEKAGVASVGAALDMVGKIDLPKILGTAMRAATDGIDSAKLTKKQRDALRAQIRDALKQAAKSIPPSEPNTHS